MENISQNPVSSSVTENLPILKTAEQKSISDTLKISSPYFPMSVEPHDNHKEALDRGDRLKSSKISSSLDSYCSTNNLNESADFAVCKIRHKIKQKDKKELFTCEICKEDITHLDVYYRSVHLNNCIDKQVSSTSSAPQPIESENVFILECPLCFKHFSSPELRSHHIKKCAKSKGLSVQSVIKALELQERHALEREALGLPLKPPKQVKSHKNPSNKKIIVEPKSKVQSDIQLAKALSLSLADSSQSEGNSENSSTVLLRPPNAQQNPGKKLLKCKKGLNVIPLLVLRTEEDRKRLLLDKVAAIVAPVQTSEEVSPVATEEIASSEKLHNDQSQVKSEIPMLWNLSGISSEKLDYYVDQLGGWINPSDIEVGTKLHHLSQIPGHKIVTQIPCDYTFSIEEENEKCVPSSGHFSVQTETRRMEQPVSSILTSLQSLVGSPWMSDVDIHVACGRVIPAHKLIMSIRCPPLKEDIDFCSSDTKTKLKWENISFNAALQFLNFVYTGNIEVAENMVSDLFYLAEKYEVLDLKTFFRANWKVHSSDEGESNEKFFQFNDVREKFLLDPASQCSKILENMPDQSQVTENEDLEMVYSYINSSFKPTQFSTDEPPHSVQKNSPKSDPKKDLSFSPLKFNIRNSEMTPKSPGNHDASSVEHEEYHVTSPVIFDVKDSDQDDSSSDSENSQIQGFSQKLEKSSSNFELEQWNLPSPKSISSEESVKILKLNLVSVSETCKQPEEENNSLCSIKNVEHEKSSTSPKNETFFTINDLKSSQKFGSQDSQILDSSGFHSNIHSDSRLSHLLNVSDSGVLSNTVDNKIDVAAGFDEENVSYEPETADRCISNSEVSVVKSDCTVNNPYKDNAIRTDESSNTVDEDCKRQIFSEKRNLSIENDAFLISKRFKECSSSQKCDSSPEVLIFDSDDELQCSLKPDSQDQIKLNYSNADSVEKIRKHIVSPEIICCNSDDEITSSLNDTLPICNNKLLSEKKSEFREASKKSTEENEGICNEDSPKSLQAAYQCLDDFALEEPYDYYEPPVFSPEAPKTNEPHSLDNEVGQDYQIAEADDLVYEELYDHNKPDTSYQKMHSVSQMHSVHSTVGDKKKLNTEDSKETATPSHKPDGIPPQFCIMDSPITPLPDYKKMMTPEIKQALKRYGVKALPRKKAVAILSHIYNETHPFLNGETDTMSSSQVSPQKTSSHLLSKKASNKEKASKCKKRKNFDENAAKPDENGAKPSKKSPKEVYSQKVNNHLSSDSEDSSSENPDGKWQGLVPEVTFSQFNEDSPTKCSKDDNERIRDYITSKEELYSNILNYQPLNIIDFHEELKMNGIKISIAKLMDFLDEQCITFTCPRKEEYKKKQTARSQRFRKKMIAKLSQQSS